MPEHTPAPTPSRAVYGFVLFLCAKTLLLLFLTWAVIPQEWFEQWNITYLPQRYWAVTIPVFLLTVLATFVFIIYPSFSLCMTPSIEDIRTVFDRVTKEKCGSEKQNCFTVSENNDDLSDSDCICKSEEKCMKKEYIKMQKNSVKYNISMVEDLYIADVSRTLYLK